MKNSKGFSLIEAIVVLVVIGTIAAIAIPYFASYRDNANLKEVARDIVADIQFYKQKAVAENVRYRILFNVSTNQYTVQYMPASSWINVATKTVGKGYDEIHMTGGSTTITIQARGTTNSETVTLKHARRLSTAEVITNTIGRVRTEYVLK